MGKNESKNRQGDSQFVHFSVHILDDEGVVAEEGCMYIPCDGCVSYSITGSASVKMLYAVTTVTAEKKKTTLMTRSQLPRVVCC